jgi:hypothetical protein
MDAAKPSLFTRFAGFIDRLKHTIVAAGAPVQGRPARLLPKFGILVHRRLARLVLRLHELLARIEAERTKPHHLARPRATTPPTQPAAPPPTTTLPRRFGWITRTLAETNAYAQTLREFLCEPETEALIASDRRIGRILRPLCHMLGIDLRIIYRMVPRPNPITDPITGQPGPDTWLSRRHPLLPEPREGKREPNPNRPTPARAQKRRSPPPHPKLTPPPQPLTAPSLDQVQSLLDHLFGARHQTPDPAFHPPDFFDVHRT